MNYVDAGVKDSTGSSENIVRILLVMMMIITKKAKMMITLMTMMVMIMITAMMMIMMMKMMFTVHPVPFSRLCCHLSTRPIGFLTTLQINQVSLVSRILIEKIPSKLEVAPPPKCGLGQWVSG